MTKKNKKGKKVGEVVAQNNVEEVAVPNETINTEPATPEVQKPSEPATDKVETFAVANGNEVSGETTDPANKKKRKRNNKKKANNVVTDQQNDVEVDNVEQGEVNSTNENQTNALNSSAKKKKNKNKNKNKAVETSNDPIEAEQVNVPASVDTKPDTVATTNGTGSQKKKKNKKNKANAPASDKQDNENLTEKLAEEIKEQFSHGQESLLKEKAPFTPPSSPVNAKKNHKKSKPQNNAVDLSDTVIREEEPVDDNAEGEFEQVKTKKSQKRKHQDNQKVESVNLATTNEVNSVQTETLLESKAKETCVEPEIYVEIKQEPEKIVETKPVEVILDSKPVTESQKEEMKPVEKQPVSTDQDKQKKDNNKKKQNQKKPADIDHKKPEKAPELIALSKVDTELSESVTSKPEQPPTSPAKEVANTVEVKEIQEPKPAEIEKDTTNEKSQEKEIQEPKPAEIKKEITKEKTSDKKIQEKKHTESKTNALKNKPPSSNVEKKPSSPVEASGMKPEVLKGKSPPRKASTSPVKCPAADKSKPVDSKEKAPLPKSDKKPATPPQQSKQQQNNNKNEKAEGKQTVVENTNDEIKVATPPPTPVTEKEPEQLKAEETKSPVQNKQPEKLISAKQQSQQGKQQNKKDHKKNSAPVKSTSPITAPAMETTKSEALEPAEEKKLAPEPIKPVEVEASPAKPVSTNKSIADIFPEPAKIQSDKPVTKPGPPSYSAIAQLPPIGSPTELPLESSDDEVNLHQIKIESERILKQTLQEAEGKVAEIKKNSDTLSESMKKLEETVADIKKEVAVEKLAQATKQVPQLPALLETLQAAEDKIIEINNVLTSTSAATTPPLDKNLNEQTEEAPALPPRAPILKDDVQSTTSSGPKNVEKGDFAQCAEAHTDVGVKSLQQPTTEEKLIEILDAQMATAPVKAPSPTIQKGGPPAKGKGSGKTSGTKPAGNKKPEVPPRPAILKPSPPAALSKSTPVAKSVPAKATSPTPVAKPASPPAKAMSPLPVKATSPSPAPKSTSPAPNVVKAQSPAPTAKNGPKPNGAVKKPEVPPRPANLKPAGATPKTGSTAKKPAAGPKPAAAKEFDSRLLQQDTANKILAFIKTLASHPSNPDASINTLSNTLAEQQKTNQPSPKSEQLTSKLLDLFLEVNDRVKQKQPDSNCDEEAMKALLTKDKIHLIDTDKEGSDSTGALKPTAVINVSSKAGKPQVQPAPKKTNEPVMDEAKGNQQIKELIQMINAPMPNVECDSDDFEELGEEEEEEFIEFRFAPREVFIASTCFVCKINLKDYQNTCEHCKMISYCSPPHRIADADNHKSFCSAIQFIAKKRGGHCYHMSKKLDFQEFRNIRVYTLGLCETDLQRPLLSFEREILLFPRICAANICREWKPEALADCEDCGLVAYCANKKEHMPDSHKDWCKQFSLYHKLVQRQKANGKIEPEMPTKIVKVPMAVPATMDDMFKVLYKNAANSLKDELLYSTMTQIATVPLTALLGLAHCSEDVPENFTIHLIGAELQFEGEAIEKWESFFLHFVPQITQLNIVFIGPEFNNENLPLDVISRIRMCRHCRQKSPPRAVKFDFQCQTFYHDYANSSSFAKPNLICFFNPGLHRKTGYNAYDTWPRTIKAAANTQCPILVTSYTQFEAPRDLERLEDESNRDLHIVQKPIINKFASQRPERNFISDEFAPMIFKNYYYFVVK